MYDLSIVIPSYNKAAHLARNLFSLSVQTFPHDRYEALVIDDGSTDETKRVVDEARARYDYRLRYFYLPRPEKTNPALSWNVGIVNAAAPVIVHQGADIIAAHNALELLHQYMMDSDGYAYVFGHCYTVHSRMANALLDHLPWHQDMHVLETILINPFHHCTYWHVPMLAAIPRERLMDIGGYDESYAKPFPEDEDTWVRLQATGVYGINAPDVWAAHQYHPQSDPPCGPDCECPLATKSKTHPGPEAKYQGTPEDIVRNRDGWGVHPGLYEA